MKERIRKKNLKEMCRVGIKHSHVDLKHSRVDLKHSRVDLKHSRVDLKHRMLPKYQKEIMPCGH